MDTDKLWSGSVVDSGSTRGGTKGQKKLPEGHPIESMNEGDLKDMSQPGKTKGQRVFQEESPGAHSREVSSAGAKAQGREQ